jgi:dihydrolipoamide dehydrogenase
VILATGARARTIPAIGLEPDGERVWTYREAMVPKAAPASLVVIGSGAIGIEFASFYRALGADVTVVEMLDRIVPVEDAEVSAAAQKAFERRGLKFRVGAKVNRLSKSKSGVTVELEVGGKAESLQAEVAIVAVGIVGNVEGLGLEALGVKIDRSHVVIDGHGSTGVAGLYAIGDIAGPPWLAHKASHEGIQCVEHIAGLKPSNLASPIPGCTYSEPQIASVGLTEAQAKEGGREVKVGRFPFRVNGKAIAAGATEGFVKTVFDAKTGALLGAHMIGHEVTEMIQGFTLAMTLEATEAELQAAVFPHPTMSEAMHEASLDAYGMVLHI